MTGFASYGAFMVGAAARGGPMPPATRLAPAAAGATLLTACSTGEPAAGPAVDPVPSVSVPSVPAPPSGSAAPAGLPDLTAEPETIATGIQVPWGLAFRPDGSALVAERQTGDIFQVRPGA